MPRDALSVRIYPAELAELDAAVKELAKSITAASPRTQPSSRKSAQTRAQARA
jgi:hypothetical protein